MQICKPSKFKFDFKNSAPLHFLFFLTEQINSECDELIPSNQETNNNNLNYESFNNNCDAKEPSSQSPQHITNRSAEEGEYARSRPNLLQALFDLNNIRQTLACFVKPRPNHARLQIYLLSVVMFAQLLVFYGITGVMFQFTEKVYFWDAATFSTISAIASVVSTGLMSLGSVVLVRLRDGTALIIGLLSDFFSELMISIFLSPLAYFVSVPIGKWVIVLFALTNLKSTQQQLMAKLGYVQIIYDMKLKHF